MLPVLAGVLLALAYPPAPFLLPVFVGLAPLLVFIGERPPGAAGRWSATRAGLVMGTVYFGLQLYWLPVALAHRPVLALPAYVLTVLVLAGFTGAFGWAVHYTRQRLGLPLVLLAALFWTTLEWGQGRVGELSVPWLGLGYALAPFPRLAGAADLVGVRGLTLWIAAVNGLLAMAIIRYRAGDDGPGGATRAGRATRPGAATLVAGAALLVATPAVYGFWRAATLETRPASRVTVMQPDIPQELKRDHAVALDTSLAVLTRLTLALPSEATDLIAWPEVALTTELERDPRLVGLLRDLSRGAGAPVLVGAYGRGRPDQRNEDGTDHPDNDEVFNSAFLIGPGGLGGPRYDKRRLVPFVERVPLVGRAVWTSARTRTAVPATAIGGAEAGASPPRRLERYGGLARGRDGPLFHATAARPPGGGDTAVPAGPASAAGAPGAAFGVLICSESIFGDLARGYRLAGAQFLVNITNDAWFAPETWYGRTTATWQHPAHLTLRAIENRIGAARAANTGISMFVDPLGRLHDIAPTSSPQARTAMVLTTDGLTLFSRWGDWLATLAAVAAAGLLAAAWLEGAGLRARLEGAGLRAKASTPRG